MQRVLFFAAIIVLLSACSSEPAKTVGDAMPVEAKPKPMAVAAQPALVTAETETQRLARVMKMLADKSVYFDYDDYSIKPEYLALVKQDYELLMSVPTMSLTLAGSADERGSTEYNLALGQKRAESVKRALKLLRVPEARLEAISYGKEKPRAACHEEKCWAENRRVDVAAGKP